MSKIQKLIVPFICALIVCWGVYMFTYSRGYIYPRIEVEKGAYWPQLKIGVCHIWIWKNGHLIYHDDFDWTPDNYESNKEIHLKAANDFLKYQNK